MLFVFKKIFGKKRKNNIIKNIKKLSEVSEKIEDLDEKVGMKYLMAKIFRDKLHDNEKACLKFTEILDKYPENVLTDAVMFELGDTYYQMKELDKATKYFNSVISSYPNSVSARKAVEKLEKISGKGE